MDNSPISAGCNIPLGNGGSKPPPYMRVGASIARPLPGHNIPPGNGDVDCHGPKGPRNDRENLRAFPIFLSF